MNTGNKQLHILIDACMIPPPFGGLANYTYQVTKHLAEQYPELKLTLLVNIETVSFYESLKDQVEIKVNKIKSEAFRLLYYEFVLPFKIGKYDLIHGMNNYGLIYAPIPKVLTIYDTFEWVSPERFHWSKRWIRRLVIWLSAATADHIITISKNSKRDIQKYYKIPGDRIEIGYIGLKYSIENKKPKTPENYFLVVGNLEPGKNLPLVLNAMSLFLREHSGVKLKVVGGKGGRSIPDLADTLDRLNLEKSVEFLGYVTDEELAGYYSNAIALIQASNYEGFGLPVVEAMACGCPVICAENSALIEAGGGAALFFETNDVNNLVKQMKELYRDPVKSKKVVRFGWNHAKRYSWKTVVQLMMSTYSTISKKDLGGAHLERSIYKNVN